MHKPRSLLRMWHMNVSSWKDDSGKSMPESDKRHSWRLFARFLQPSSWNYHLFLFCATMRTGRHTRFNAVFHGRFASWKGSGKIADNNFAVGCAHHWATIWLMKPDWHRILVSDCCLFALYKSHVTRLTYRVPYPISLSSGGCTVSPTYRQILLRQRTASPKTVTSLSLAHRRRIISNHGLTATIHGL